MPTISCSTAKVQISTVLIGVGGFLSIGEKGVGVPFGRLTFSVGKDCERIIVVAVSTEKTTYDKVKDKAVDLGHKAAHKACELKDQAPRRSTT